jgi:hypothetical protein
MHRQAESGQKIQGLTKESSAFPLCASVSPVFKILILILILTLTLNLSLKAHRPASNQPAPRITKGVVQRIMRHFPELS